MLSELETSRSTDLATRYATLIDVYTTVYFRLFSVRVDRMGFALRPTRPAARNDATREKRKIDHDENPENLLWSSHQLCHKQRYYNVLGYVWVGDVA